VDIKDLIDCQFVSDISQLGATVEFKTILYSPVSMQMEHVTISCPMSGNYILTDAAKIIEGDVGVPEERHKDLLVQVFSSLEQSTGVSKLIDKKQILPDSFDSRMQELALKFLGDLSEEELKKDSEELKFSFLHLCSKNFQDSYVRYTS